MYFPLYIIFYRSFLSTGLIPPWLESFLGILFLLIQLCPRVTTRGFLGHLCILETAVIERGEKVQTVETVCMTVGCSTNYRRPEVFDT